MGASAELRQAKEKPVAQPPTSNVTNLQYAWRLPKVSARKFKRTLLIRHKGEFARQDGAHAAARPAKLKREVEKAR